MPLRILLLYAWWRHGWRRDGDDLKVKAYLEAAGVTFDESKGHRFAFDGFLIIVTHDRRTLDKIERILARLDKDTSKQVEIETKFLEVQEGALDEISFDWQFGWGIQTKYLIPKLEVRKLTV